MHRFFPPRNVLYPNENSETSKSHYKRSNFRMKSSSHVTSNLPNEDSNQKQSAREVRIRLVFVRIGDIDTLNEKYQADVYFEARWADTMNVRLLDLTPDQQSQLLHENVIIRTDKFDAKEHWTPQLYIENAIGQIGEQDKWFTIMKRTSEKSESLSPPVANLEICEHRRVKGVFWEKLELNHFPADVQDLTVSITTHHYIEDCQLVQDPQLRSSINREAFFDQQEWKLYEHVSTELRESKEEYSYEDENLSIVQKKHSVLAVTCCAARRPAYYYWNGFCLIFLITICAFCIFSIPPDLPQSRLQITCTLLLTSITFRWVVNRSLPTISYLTTLDKYAIISIIMLVLLCIWHSIIAAFIFLNPDVAVLKGIAHTNVYANIDRYVCISAILCYIIIHIILLIWLIRVPYKRRRKMEFLDREYAAKKNVQSSASPKPYKSMQSEPNDLVFRRASSIHEPLPLVKSPVRLKKPSESVIVFPNPAAFVPIEEETSESMTKGATTIQLEEQDDVFYDHTNDINYELKSTQVHSMEKL
ncbi:unnamed protein product [Adineta ricciae]|uniref:Uncharacterized protein n=1 Tax=Adineta ricciae TaxID=249248 RepID=A0A814AZ68_ADIRI|nr:unnamed protein product [Adineta ricciae]